MCGFVLLYGECVHDNVEEALARIEHRGPDAKKVHRVNQYMSLGFCRLAIHDPNDNGMQPFEYKNILCMVNGEIFNSEQLRERYGVFDLAGGSDCELVAPMFALHGVNMVEYLDGFFAGVIIDHETNKIFTVRDKLGKKPLFFGQSKGLNFLTSELKSQEHIDRFVEIPPGVCEIDIHHFRMTPIVDYPVQMTQTGRIDGGQIVSLLDASVRKRLPTREQPCAVFLSGGLDSSIIASIVAKYRDDVVYLCLANKESEDFKHTQRLVQYLSLRRVVYIDLPDGCELQSLIKKVVGVTDSFNPSIVSNGVGTYILSEYARKIGMKVVISGEGADELFCGYFRPSHRGDILEKRKILIENMRNTELRRIDLCGMAHGVEIRCPFLDMTILDFASKSGLKQCYGEMGGKKMNKYMLRQAFQHTLPNSIVMRQKVSFDVGSGLRKKVQEALLLLKPNLKEREALMSLWKESSNYPHLVGEPYFSEYPVFDRIIDARKSVHT